ncbi:hypothetical protein HMPREF9163_01212 [Selenomonas sp. oral taxon 138 str. F0429]|nr:hypothetical protein HMPREF9163_01212 [Selenomonas sp. oral taxon 138 str. F0429]
MNPPNKYTGVLLGALLRTNTNHRKYLLLYILKGEKETLFSLF